MHCLLTAVLLQKAYDRIRHDDETNDAGLDPIVHCQGQTHGADEDEAHDIDEVLEKENEGVDGAAAFQGIAAKGLPAPFHSSRGEAFVGIDL